ncbi:MAG: retropepsin-like aspartic protease [Chloroherpetonaceae bacterium]|nr:retropepsin-like domain-containing protein [Chloroherpetonaceae bacterium]MCS7210602.1 retropepsin-like domain-containing protein [Chloroherpetonaceae bacterium]MDW8020200.1 retropepsin-like aspartic protease [Chloroherpetonaceae bacterium]MDW8465150.1 retropepsin-like aspartic protease [Chloroherpetonaceae bacterium]
MSIQFQLASRQLPLILVKAEIVGAKKSRLVTAIVDTGATGCVITQNIASEMEFKPIEVPSEEKSAHGIGGAISIEFVRVNEIRLDQVVAKRLRVAVMDMSMIHNQFNLVGISPKRKVEMILGFPFFKGHKLIIDYTTRTLSLK